MNSRLRPSLRASVLGALAAAAVVFSFTGLAPRAVAAETTATISGNVSNATTGNLLAGARIALPALGLAVLSDDSGRYEITGVPAGSHEVVATYLGLDAMKFTVAVAAAQRTVRNFDLTSAIYQLDTFKVTGEREGQAAAITAQRNADNVKNVVAIDAFGNLPNMNASELAVMLPGVAGNLSDEGNIVGFTIRGMGPGLNTITVDGALMGSQAGSNRQTRIHTITGSMFEELELTKGQRPDQGVDSLGANINLKSRSPLSMREKRRVTYNFSARLAPPGTQQIPLREQHRAHPLLNVAYQEVFDAFGGERNLGVALNFFYSEQAVGFFSTTRDYQSNNAAGTPAYLWDYGTQDNYNNRRQSSVNAKIDWRLSPHTKISLNAIYNDAFERFRLRYSVRAFSGSAVAVPNATTSGVVPGFTDRITEVRAVAGSTIDITSQMSQFFHRQRTLSFEVEQHFGPLDLDYAAVMSPDHITSTGGDGGVLVNRLTGVGWRLDRTASDLFPQLVQTGGPSWGNAANYRPNSFNFADARNLHEPREVRANARYKLPTDTPLYFKTGVRLREEMVADTLKSKRYNFLGANSGQLPTDPTIQTFGDHRTGLVIPAWNANAIARARTPVDPTLWSEDRYFYESNLYSGTKGTTENVYAGYLMTQGKIGRTGFLAGVRVEDTHDDSYGWTKARVGTTAAQQVTDPAGSAAKDFSANKRWLHGSYSNTFPSIHLTEDFTANLKGRASWSTSMGRPPLTNLQPAETFAAATPTDPNGTLTINNPSLRPEKAQNWDLTLEYYFEPVGSLSAGFFRKVITDYFVTGIEMGTVATGADNGYNGDYAGAKILTRSNLGTAYVQGWEMNYQQQFTFLPGPLKGLGASFNYTLLDTHGDFGSAVQRTTGQVAGFIPRTANATLSWRYHKFSTRLTGNRTGTYVRTFSAPGSGANLYTRSRTIVSAGLGYQVRPAVSLSLDVQNIFNTPQSWYRGVPDQLAQVYIPGITVTAGVSGRF